MCEQDSHTLRLFLPTGDAASEDLTWLPPEAPADPSGQPNPGMDRVLNLVDVPLSRTQLVDALDRLRLAGGSQGLAAVLVGNPWRQRLRLLRDLGRPTQVRSPSGRQPLGPSLRRVTNALAMVGFHPVRVFEVGPSDKELRWFVPRRLATSWRSPAYLVVCALEGVARASMLDDIATSVVDQAFGPHLRHTSHVLSVLASEKEKSLVFMRCGAQEAVVRVTHSTQSRSVESAAHATLRALQSNPLMARMTPQPLASGQVRGTAFFAESRLQGKTLSTAVGPADRTRYAPQIDNILRSLNPGLTENSSDAPGRAWDASVCRPMLNRVLAALTDPVVRTRAKSLIEGALEGATSRIGLTHGDFSANNLMVHGSRVVGVIDWENSRRDAPPVLDALNYLDSVQRHSQPGMTLADTVPLLAKGPWPVAAEWTMAEAAFRRCGIDMRFRCGFALLYWLCHVGPQLAFGGTPPDLVNRRLQRVLMKFLD